MKVSVNSIQALTSATSTRIESRLSKVEISQFIIKRIHITVSYLNPELLIANFIFEVKLSQFQAKVEKASI